MIFLKTINSEIMLRSEKYASESSFGVGEIVNQARESSQEVTGLRTDYAWTVTDLFRSIDHKRKIFNRCLVIKCKKSLASQY